MDIKDMQLKIVNNIIGQDIKLIKTSFFSDKHKAGIINENDFKINLNVKIKEMGEGVSENNINKQDIIFADYNFNLKYTRNDEKEPFIKIKTSYRLIIYLKEKINFFKDEDEKNKNINIFFDSTGRVMVYPYFRHTSDFLTRESSFIIPPLPPLKI